MNATTKLEVIFGEVRHAFETIAMDIEEGLGIPADWGITDADLTAILGAKTFGDLCVLPESARRAIFDELDNVTDRLFPDAGPMRRAFTIGRFTILPEAKDPAPVRDESARIEARKAANPSTDFFVWDDGGRSDAGFTGSTGDCVVRACAIATGEPYADVYSELAVRQKDFAHTSRARRAKSMKAKKNWSPRNGVARDVIHAFFAARGWVWTPTMSIGSGCTMHVRPGEVPRGRVVLNLSKHVTACVDGVLRDTYDPSRAGTRCVYGYWSEPLAK